MSTVMKHLVIFHHQSSLAQVDTVQELSDILVLHERRLLDGGSYKGTC